MGTSTSVSVSVGSLQYRYEQRRGHYLVAEGTDDLPLTRQACDAFQMRMMTACEVPGLLKLEVEEIDGRLSLRYALTGTRMLSQVMRANKWTMTVFMGALCRLAEVMEDCRLYVLDPDGLLLEDDRIFIGEAGEQDLRFVLLPIPADPGASARGLTSLIVRWMMHIANPDGTAIQQMLRLAASPEFKPAALSKFARQYLARDVDIAGNVEALPGLAEEPRPGSSVASGAVDRTEPSAAPGWRWFQPASTDAQAMSGLLGGDGDLYGEAPEAPPPPLAPDDGRKRTWTLCGAVAVIAVAWRWGYAASPDAAGLSLSLGATIAAIAAAGWLLRSFRPRRQPVAPDLHPTDQRPESSNGPRVAHPQVAVNASSIRAGFATGFGLADAAAEKQPNDPGSRLGGRAAPTWEEDRTQHLEPQMGKKPSQSHYLVWESESHAPPIPLAGASLVIGRSKEASGHVDVTPGISRAHLELLRTDEGWSATDLGSRNGSKLNGTEMVAYESYPLRPGDSLELAGSVYRLKYGRLQDAG